MEEERHRQWADENIRRRTDYMCVLLRICLSNCKQAAHVLQCSKQAALFLPDSQQHTSLNLAPPPPHHADPLPSSCCRRWRRRGSCSRWWSGQRRRTQPSWKSGGSRSRAAAERRASVMSLQRQAGCSCPCQHTAAGLLATPICNSRAVHSDTGEGQAGQGKTSRRRSGREKATKQKQAGAKWGGTGL